MDIKFPYIKNVPEELLSDTIIDVKPGETMTQALKRFILEQRMKKIIKMKKKIKGS